MGPWLLCSIALVAGASANPAVQITSPTVTDPPLVIATGDAILLQAPDLAFVMIGIEGQGGRPRNAEDEAAKTMTTLQASIKALGFSGDAIKTVSFSLQPRYQYGGGRQYLARHVIEVRVDDLTRIGDLLDAAAEARTATISSLRFDLKDRHQLELAALRAAVKDATERAHAIAEGSGRTLGAILRIQEQRSSSPSPVFRLGQEPVPATAGRGGGGGVTTPIEPGQIQVRAQVTLTAAIK